MGCLKMVPKGNLSEMISNGQISIGYEDNQIMTVLSWNVAWYRHPRWGVTVAQKTISMFPDFNIIAL